MKIEGIILRLYKGLKIVMLLLLIIGISGCSKDDDNLSGNNPNLSSDKQITSFVFLLTTNPITKNVIGVIDQNSKSISATMPEGTDLNGLIPEIQVSQGAVVSPSSAQDFTNIVDYIVSAEDGSTETYTVLITATLSQRQILQIFLDANPRSTLNWDIPNTTNLGTLSGVSTNANGDVIELALYESQLSVIPPEIGQLSSLIKLDLSENSIVLIPPEIGQLSKLAELNLQENSIILIPPEIGQLDNLTSLRLYENSIGSLPLEIGNLNNLRELNLHDNSIRNIPPEIGNLIKLVYLNLNDNPIRSIPPEIGFLLKLENLSIYIQTLKDIPISLCNLVNFNNLDLLIPQEVSCTNDPTEMDGLISIYASNPNNSLNWSVNNYPEIVINKDGKVINITMNNKNLKRLRSTSLASLKSLEVFNASQNSFGSIPSSIGNINSLSVLTFHQTNLRTVPASLGNLNNLALLTLTSNPITSIPKSVCDLQISNGGILTILTDTGEGCK